MDDLVVEVINLFQVSGVKTSLVMGISGAVQYN
jgi:hypothetical protein